MIYFSIGYCGGVVVIKEICNDAFQRKSSDEQLAEMATKGDSDSYNRLISRYVPIVKMRASGYFGTVAEPEDLAQEGMIGLLAAIRSYSAEKGASFRTFALLCIDRSIISAVRSALSKGKIPDSAKVSLDNADESDSEGIKINTAGGMSTEEIVLANEGHRLLEQKMQELLTKPEQRVLMLHLGGCSYDEISKRLVIQKKAVDNTLYRIRKKLKNLS